MEVCSEASNILCEAVLCEEIHCRIACDGRRLGLKVNALLT